MAPILVRALILSRLMRTPLVIPVDPFLDSPPYVLKPTKLVLPHTLFFETSEKAFNQAILFWCIGRDKFLFEPIVSIRFGKTPTLKN